MMERIGPTRLILLNCGKFDYAEIDLDVPLHLVGPNNIGKTSLIALLQFLYIDEQTRMRFSRDIATTRKYYFPDVSSFALFESLGPEGFMLTGVHGLGPVRKYDIERFACQGQYRQSDFLSDDNRILPWDQTKANLASRGYTGLRPSDLRNALMGHTLKKGPPSDGAVNLSLVPVRKWEGYKRFCTVFLNLLRLSHLRQEELKILLLELCEGDFTITKRQINLQEDFAPQLDQLQRQKADVQDLHRNEGAIRRILENVAHRDQLRTSLKALYDLMGQLFQAFKTQTHDHLEKIASQLEHLAGEAKDLDLRHERVMAEHNERLQEKGRLDQIQQELCALADQFSDYHPQWSDSQICELEKKVRTLESTLESVAHDSPEAIERRLNTDQNDYKQLNEQLEHIEHSVASVLIQHMGADQTGQLSRLFNKGILRLSTQGEDAKARINDVQGLVRQLNGVLARFQGSTYQDQTVTLALGAMAQFDPADYLDAGRLREQLVYLHKAIQQTQKTLHAARDHAAHVSELAEQKGRLETLLDQRTRFRDYQIRKEQHKDIAKQALAVDRELARSKAQLADVTARQQQLQQKTIHLENDRHTLTDQLDKVGLKIQDMPRAEDTWLSGDLPSKKMDLQDVMEHYRQLSDQHQRLAHHIDGELETIHNQTYSRYQGATEQETWANFHAELESLKEKQAALDQSWLSFTVQLKKDFKELNRDMEKLSAKVHSLNGQLAKVHISNLANLKIVLSSRAEFRSHFTQVERSEAEPLFADTAKTDEAMRKISQMLQERPVISLEDMFDMHFEITTLEGGTKKYDHLDRIESNGTTITIKVLINLILLRGLLINENVNVPFYLDECSSLDSENLRSIVQEARKLGFIAVLASPEAMDAADHLYYLSEHQGRVTLNPKHSLVEIVRIGSDPE